MIFPKNKRKKNLAPLFLAGPTGVGKSAFAVQLASRIDGEIVGADAFQIYSELPLLTAQPDRDLQAQIPHYMIGCVGIKEYCNVVWYQREASQRIKEILQRGKTPLVVGGTGLYFRALIQGLDSLPPSDPFLRKELEQLSLPQLQERLLKNDARAKEIIDIRNPRRVLRAIEICELSGKPLKDLYSQTPKKKKIRGSFPARGWLLLRERDILKDRISTNVRRMWEQGVVQEVKKVLDSASSTASQAIGFGQIVAFLRGIIDETQCQESICQATRQYAKRQLTWFRNQTAFTSLDLSAFRPSNWDSLLKDDY